MSVSAQRSPAQANSRYRPDGSTGRTCLTSTSPARQGRGTPAAISPLRTRQSLRRSPSSAVNLVIYWTGFRANTFLFSLAATGFVPYAVYYHVIARKPASRFGCKNIAWLLP